MSGKQSKSSDVEMNSTLTPEIKNLIRKHRVDISKQDAAAATHCRAAQQLHAYLRMLSNRLEVNDEQIREDSRTALHKMMNYVHQVNTSQSSVAKNII